MCDRDAVAMDDRSGREEESKTRRQKVLAFVKSHGIEITLGAGCLALTVICVKQGRTIDLQRKLLEKKDVLLSAKDSRIGSLVELCAEKDRCHLELASAALRDGCSEGGRTLADYRYYLDGQR